MAEAGMKLWIVDRPDDGVNYDEAAGFVVAAPTEAIARALAADQAGEEGKTVWVTTARCEPLEAGTEARVIISDFRAG
jgi:hypothetical protein